MSWLIQEAIENFFKHLFESAINLFLEFLTVISGISAQVLDMPVVTSGILYSQVLAGSILAAKVAYEAWLNYILRENGDPDADPGGLLFRTIQAAAIISTIPWLVRWMYQFGTTIASDIAGLPGVNYEQSGGILDQFFTKMIVSGSYPLFIAIGGLFALVILIIIFIQTFIRAAELAVVAVAGSFMALGLTNTGSELFGNWWKELISISLAQSIQIFLVKISFFTLTYFEFGGIPLFNLFLFIGFLWVTYKSPSIIRQYAHSTGLGKAAGGSAQSIGSMVLMRRMMRR